MSAKIKFRVTSRSASVNVGRKSFSFKSDSDGYRNVIESAKSGNWDWLTLPKSPKSLKDNGVRVKDGNLEVQDPDSSQWEIPPVGWQELYKKYEESNGVGSLVRMWISLRKANQWIQKQVLNGLHAGRFAVRPNGNLVMFRGFVIRNGILVSGHDNSRWEWGKKRREQYYDERVRSVCTRGLHAAPWDTVRGVYGHQTIVEVDIEPCDIVAIPTEDSYPKIRAKAMTPIRFCPNDPKYGMFAPEVPTVGSTNVDVKEDAKISKRQQDDLISEGTPEKCGEFILDFNTDRITIPSSQFESCGFVDKGTVKLYHTDPRARFMLVTKTTGADVKFFQSCKVLKRDEWEWSHEASSNRSVSIRQSSLASCMIYGFGKYKVETWVHNDHHYATIRPVK